MSGTNSSRNKALLAGVLGAGALLAGAGLLIYSHLGQKKKVDALQRQLARNPNHLSRNSDSSSAISRSSLSVSSDMESQYLSARNSDEEDDDFYDCMSDEEILQNKSIEDIKLFERVDVLMKGEDEDRLKAFKILSKQKVKMGENVEFLWRFAKAHQIQAAAYGAQNNLEEKKKHVFEGLKYASKALSMVDTNADVHKWFAILTGMQADFVSVKQKIQNGYLFQKHVLIAISIKPNDYSLYHLLGRFKFELANISWFEKKMAASLFAELPNVTYRDAIADLLKAEKLNTTPWKENRLLLAKCYLGNGDTSVAIDWLDSAKKITPRTKEDAANDLQINLLLEQYKNYLK